MRWDLTAFWTWVITGDNDEPLLGGSQVSNARPGAPVCLPLRRLLPVSLLTLRLSLVRLSPSRLLPIRVSPFRLLPGRLSPVCLSTFRLLTFRLSTVGFTVPSVNRFFASLWFVTSWFGGLAGWTPVEGAAGQVFALDGGPADETGLAVTTVDVVDLFGLGFAFWVGTVFGSGGHDAAVFHAAGHQRYCVAPEAVQGFFGNVLAACEGVLAGAVEQFGTIDVTDAGEEGLVHEESGDGGVGLAYVGDGRPRVGLGRERIGTQAGFHRLPLGFGIDGDVGGAAQLQPVGRGGPAHAQHSLHFGKGHLAFDEVAEAAEVDVQLAIAAEVVGQVLAVGDHGFKLAASQQGSAGEAAVGRFHADGLADIGRGVEFGETVYLIAFGHVSSLPFPLPLDAVAGRRLRLTFCAICQ